MAQSFKMSEKCTKKNPKDPYFLEFLFRKFTQFQKIKTFKNSSKIEIFAWAIHNLEIIEKNYCTSEAKANIFEKSMFKRRKKVLDL